MTKLFIILITWLCNYYKRSASVCVTLCSCDCYHASCLNDKSLKRQKVAIACIRITGRHTYDILAAKIEEIHRSFGLHGKISATVTDNGSNFVKAFTCFSVQETEHDNDDKISMVDDDGVVPDDDVEFTDLHSLMIPDQDDDDLTQVEYELPPHHQCASHTLNLVASTNVEKHLLSSSLSKSLYRSSYDTVEHD